MCVGASGSEAHAAQSTPMSQTHCISLELVLGSAFEVQQLSRYIWEMGDFGDKSVDCCLLDLERSTREMVGML